MSKFKHKMTGKIVKLICKIENTDRDILKQATFHFISDLFICKFFNNFIFYNLDVEIKGQFVSIK